MPSTYIRKIGEGRYEYGFVSRAKNFRKQPDIYRVVGEERSVTEAEEKRSRLEEVH